MNKKRIAIIGTGTIGTSIATELENHLNEEYQLVGMMKRTTERIDELTSKYDTNVVTNFDELLSLSPDFIVEAASVEVVRKYGEVILDKGIHFIPLSIGALADSAFYEILQKKAQENNAILYISSGAIGGFDLMRKMTLAASPEVEINTYKSPNSLSAAPFLKNKTLSKDKKEIIFEGFAKEDIPDFPKNINVAIATALATVGPEKVHTIIHSDPKLTENIHEITMNNKEGTATIRFEAQRSNNVSTSSITPWSVIALLKNITGPIHFF